MMTGKFGMGFMDRMPFGTEAGKELFEKWSEMTDGEKLAFMNGRMEAMNNSGDVGKREFGVEAIDRRCEEWMKKTPEEKQEAVYERKEMMSGLHGILGFSGGWRNFGFGRFDGGAGQERG